MGLAVAREATAIKERSLGSIATAGILVGQGSYAVAGAKLDLERAEWSASERWREKRGEKGDKEGGELVL